MAFKIVIINTKGGVGKSTLAVSLASMFAMMFKKEAGIVDMDSQKSISSFLKLNEVDKKAGSTIETGLKLCNGSEQDMDVLIFDCPPYVDNATRTILESADFVLCPFKYSLQDTMALNGFLKILDDVKKKRPDLKYALVLGQVDTRKRDLIDSAETFARSLNRPLLNTKMIIRESYINSFRYGLFATEDGKNLFNDKLAKGEILGIWKEIQNIILNS